MYNLINLCVFYLAVANGTNTTPLRCIVKPDTYGQDVHDSDAYADQRFYVILSYKDVTRLSTGCTIEMYAIVKEAPDEAKQDFELSIVMIRLIGGVEDPSKYPIQKSSWGKPEALRQHPFRRQIAPLSGALFKIGSKVTEVITRVFAEHGVVHTRPNIITKSDCEGAGEVFKIRTETGFFGGHVDVASDDEDIDVNGYDTTHGLTVSSQLPLEAFALAHRAVYVMQKSFRAEKSNTGKHLAEFLHAEYEEFFTTLSQLIDFTEQFIKEVIRTVIEECGPEYDVLSDKVYGTSDRAGLRERILEFIEKDFVRITHADAITMMQDDLKKKVQHNGKRLKFKVYPRHGEDLGSEHEKYLVEKFGTFVFVTHWPSDIKSFYMKKTYVQDESGEWVKDGTCESFDLLAPFVGELFGGSMREWRYDDLMAEMEKKEMSADGLEWFIDLRKNGSAPHGGWGMGVDRLIAFITGSSSVRDIVPLPVYYGHCPY